MAGKKQITKTKKVTEETTPVVEQTTQTVTEQTMKPVTEQITQTAENNTLSKSGRTLVVKSKDGSSFDLSSFDTLPGLVSKSEVKQHNSLFLTFDSIANAETALDVISKNYTVKYSYYKVFVTLSTNLDESNFDKTKQELTEFIEDKTGSTMLFCKFYRKNSSYMNCGYLIVDTIDGMKKLISKESELKQFKTESLSGTFYRFNNSKYNSQNTQSSNV